jgi:hypothetical protein
MARLYKSWNGPAPTTAALAPVTTGTAIKTMLQLALPATADGLVVSWGLSFDATAIGAPVKCELIETDVAATVTAHVAAGVTKQNAAALQLASQMTLGTAATGYTATAEGTITATRLIDYQQVTPTANQYAWEWSLGREAYMQPSKFMRVRVTSGTAYNMVCWIMWEE